MNMDWNLYAGYIMVLLLFMLTPGPSHLLMLSQSLKFGFNKARFVAFGDLSANAVQMTLASYGLAGLIHESPAAFEVVKWLGVTYLIYLGWKTTRASGMEIDDRINRNGFFVKGFMASATNPKAVVFFASLFPQFLDIDRSIGPQLVLLGATYIVVDGSFLFLYGKLASWVAAKYSHRIETVNRLAGVLLIIAALILALKSL